LNPSFLSLLTFVLHKFPSFPFVMPWKEAIKSSHSENALLFEMQNGVRLFSLS
jgi:hypothetical protein